MARRIKKSPKLLKIFFPNQQMQDKKVEELFEEQIKYYSQVDSSSSNSPLVDLFLNWAKNQKTTRKIEVAEFGGAAGQLLAAINSKYPNVSLTNIELVTRYRKEQVLKKIKFINGSILNSKFKDKSFDSIIISDVLHHLIGKNFADTRKNQLLALKELKRIVRPGGIILIDELTNESEFICRLLFYFSRLNSHIGIRIEKLEISPQTIICLFTARELTKLINKIFSKDIIKTIFIKRRTTWQGVLVHFGAPYGKLICSIRNNH